MALLKRPAFRLAILVVASLGIVRPSGAAPAETMRWYGSIEAASAAARPANRPLMLDFWADWCVACKVMEREVYTNADFLRAAGNFFAVRIDHDKKMAIARKYKIEALPTLVFTDSLGNELFKYVGTMEVTPLTLLLRSLPQDVTAFNRLNQVLAKDRNNFPALDGMGRSLRAAGLFRASNEYYAKALQRDEAKTDPVKREAILTDIGANYLEVKEGKKAAEVFERCLKEFPTSARKGDWTSNLARARAMAVSR